VPGAAGEVAAVQERDDPDQNGRWSAGQREVSTTNAGSAFKSSTSWTARTQAVTRRRARESERAAGGATR